MARLCLCLCALMLPLLCIAADTDAEGGHKGCASGESQLELQMLPPSLAESVGAKCLDGSTPGYWIEKATNASHANDWQLYFQGGGWCYSAIDCFGRSKTTLGSSKAWPSTQCLGGMLASDCTANPDFCQYNKVHFGYCDGNSFASNLEPPLDVGGDSPPGSQIWFRGKRNIDATLLHLAREHGLGAAVNIMQTGASAGGLAAYLHADYVHDFLTRTPAGTGQPLTPNLVRYKAAPISGFFLDHTNVLGDSVYGAMMQHLFHVSNATGGVNQACIAASTPDTAWKCNFASGSYAHTKVPIFALNSALDSWQTGCIYTATLDPGFPKTTPPGLDEHGNCANAGAPFSSAQCKDKPRAACTGPWTACAKSPEACNATQMAAMDQYITDFQQAMAATRTYTKAGNGAFVHSCHTHCEAQTTADWTKFKVGGVSIQEAVGRWWASDGHEPASTHTYTPCQYKTTSPHKCNPTCN